MRFRALILAVAIAALGGTALTGCSDNDSKTISLDDWVKKVETVCQPAAQASSEVQPPESLTGVSDLSALTDAQIAEIGDFLEELQAIVSPAVDSIADVGTPDEKADQAEEFLETLRAFEDQIQSAIDSVQSGDNEQLQKDLESSGQDDERQTELEKELGISCGSEQDG